MNKTNPVNLWKYSLLDDKESFAGSSLSASPLFRSSPVISSFSGDPNYFRKIFKQWPVKMERNAVFWPAHVPFITCGATGILIGVRVNSQTFLGDANFSYAESLRKCPKLTWMIALYSSALCYFGLNENAVSKYIYSQGDQCNSCLIASSIMIALLGGIGLPMLSTPYLTAVSAILQGDRNAMPQVRKNQNWLNYVFRWKVGINACRGVLLRMALGLSAVSGASMSIRLWGRQRILDTLTVEPEFVAAITTKE